MAKPKIKSVCRQFTAEERQRFEQAKQWSQANRETLQQGADKKLAQMEAAFAAMQVLKAEREKRGISLGELATRTGIDKSNLSKLENDLNTNPTLETLLRIARALGGTIEFVFRAA